ncbi:AAA family ATPase [Jutongia sp.]
MKLKEVRCDQFAGLNRNDPASTIKFDDGLNLIVGDNEQGKSTMVDLIYYLLFKDVKLDTRSDKEFIARYFPQKTTGRAGDVIDGALVFEDEEGECCIRKEWEKKDGICRLTLPDGTLIRDPDALKQYLRDTLPYQEGIYGEIVFASQKRQLNCVKSIMEGLNRDKATKDKLQQTKETLLSVLNRAALETGGVALDELEKQLDQRLTQYNAHWDEQMELPEGGVKRGIHNKWKREVGLILQAYYEMEEVRGKLQKAEADEEACEEITDRIRSREKEKELRTAEKEEFSGVRTALKTRHILLEKLTDQTERIREMEKVLQEWPKLSGQIAQAQALKEQRNQAVLLRQYEQADRIRINREATAGRLQQMMPVTQEDIDTYRKAQRRKAGLEGKMSGLSLVARIQMEKDTAVHVSQLASGEELVADGNEFQINAAVEIEIPDVMKMQLLPQDVDVDVLREEIKACDVVMKRITDQYKTDSCDKLEEMKMAYQQCQFELERLDAQWDQILDGADWESLKTAGEAARQKYSLETAGEETAHEYSPETVAYTDSLETEEQFPHSPLDLDEIDDSIRTLCGTGVSLEEYLGGRKAKQSDYEAKYHSIEELKKQKETLEQERGQTQKEADETDQIPDKYRRIPDPDRYLTELNEEIKELEEDIRQSNARKNELSRSMDEVAAEEYAELLEEKAQTYERTRKAYQHWKHISEVFQELKEKSGDNPVQDIEDHFRKYLSEISQDALDASMDERMEVDLANGTRRLTYDTLSDGTKDTIALAFRLAMLEHLFPEGNGLAVFDDSFTDMDPGRVRQACRLVQKFAERNQVIFTTCDNKYEEIFENGPVNVVHIGVD